MTRLFNACFQFTAKGKSARAAILTATLICAASPMQAEDAAQTVKVEVVPAVVKEKRLPASQIAAKLHGEAANTDWTFSARPSFNFSTVSERTLPTGHSLTGQLTNAQIKLSLDIITLLPLDVTEKVLNHEHAHEEICERVYKESVPLLEPAANALIGEKFTAVGATHDAAVKAVNQKIGNTLAKKYMDRVNSICPKINAIFDKITEHATNSADPKAAIEEAFQEFEQSEHK